MLNIACIVNDEREKKQYSCLFQAEERVWGNKKSEACYTLVAFNNLLTNTKEIVTKERETRKNEKGSEMRIMCSFKKKGGGN